MRKHSLAQSARLLCGDNPPHSDPEKWLARQLRAGRFRGQKIGRFWFMTDADIEAAEESLYPAGAEPLLHGPEPEPVGIVSGLSERGRRRLKSAS